MLDILWFILIIYLVHLGLKISKLIKCKNYKITKILKKLNYDSLYLSLGTKMGVGTIIGTTMSLYIGGPGSLLWIYIFTLLTSSIIYAESYLGSKYKQKYNDSYISGIYYYTKFGLKKNFLAIITLILFVSTYSLFFLMIQTNTIAEILNTNNIIFAIILLILITLLVTNDANQISKLLNKIVPVMCTFFIIISLYTIIKNIEIIPIIIKNIFQSAWNPKTIFIGMIIGIKRSIFLNELLIGTTSMSSGINNEDTEITANTLTIGTYFITFIMSTLIALLILIFMYYKEVPNITYNELLIHVFNYHFNSFGSYFLGILISLLATTTIISGFYIGISNLTYIFKSKIINNIFKITFTLLIISGIFINTTKLWYYIDIMMFILIIINAYIVNKLKNKI
jgi:AGCS family alanine or glycine:cation symporter